MLPVTRFMVIYLSLMAEVKLVSINIEGDKHLELLAAFLKEFKPEVVLLQEVFDEDLRMLASEFSMESRFSPMWQKERVEGSGEKLLLWGMGWLTNLPIVKESVVYYFGDGVSVPVFDRSKIEKCGKAVMMCEVEKGDKWFRFCNTHFTWTPDGQPTPRQFRDLKQLLIILGKFGELILCGDFNAPRGRSIWSEIAKEYKDNIPEEVESTLDPKHHRKNFLKFVVDGLFTTSGNRVEDVEIIDGLSDHCAIAATVVSTT